jgi:WD40 repeat protein
VEGGEVKFNLPVNTTATAIAAHGNTVAIGSEVHNSFLQMLSSIKSVGSKDKTATLYEWDGSGLKELRKLTSNKGIITAIAFSPDAVLVAVADVSDSLSQILLCYLPFTPQSAGKIYVYNVANQEV